jgi:hypothetical protein
LISTEKDYVDFLKKFVDHFYQPLKTSSLNKTGPLDEKDIKDIFSNCKKKILILLIKNNS